ncbi:MAG: ATP synthase F0 subunit C [Candidatus Cryptobacteroides sp.]
MVLALLLQVVAGAVFGKVAAVLGAAATAFAAGYGIGKIGTSAMEAIARQPESAGDVRNSMIIVAGMIEGAALFAIIVCLLAIVLK